LLEAIQDVFLELLATEVPDGISVFKLEMCYETVKSTKAS